MSLPRDLPRSAARTTHRRRPRLAGSLAVLVGAVTTIGLLPAPADATPWPGHPDRSIVRHAVGPGETATGLAVRYHAWTDELVRLNHLGPSGRVYRGQVLLIPVVVSATHHRTHHRTHPRPAVLHGVTPRHRGWTHDRMTRAQVRREIVAVAHRYHVPASLALAVAWQESGWQQRRVSSVGALGVMQVMPDTGRWMRWYAGRPLRLRDTHDNVQAGVLTLRVLRAWTRRDNTAIAAYYQGLGAVRQHGWFKDTRRYVRAVRAHQRLLIRTGSPV